MNPKILFIIKLKLTDLVQVCVKLSVDVSLSEVCTFLSVGKKRGMYSLTTVC